MDNATLAVVGSICAALGGAVVGAAINGWWSRRLDRDRAALEKQAAAERVRAAALLVFSELGLAMVSVQGGLDGGKWTRNFTVDAWKTHGLVLAEGLDAESFEAVVDVCARLESVRETGPPDYVLDLGENPYVKDALEALVNKLEAAQRALHPIAYPGAGPLDESGVAGPPSA